MNPALERIADLETRVGKSKAALEALADRAAKLRERLTSAAAFVASLDQLSQARMEELPVAAPETHDGEDGRLLSDAWEIALINEEGK